MRSSIALIALSLAGFGTLGCVRETVSCADHPSAVCTDSGAADIDAATDARARTDTNNDAFSVFDAWAPDAGNDAWEPDAYIVPDGNCGCTGNLICVAGAPGGCGCIDNTQCGGATPACDTATHMCVPCVDSTTCTAAGARACDIATHTCVACVDNGTCTDTANPVCRTDTHTCVPCTDGASGACMGTTTPACASNACVECSAMNASRCTGTTPSCDTDNTCTCTSTSCTSATAARCNTTTNDCEGCMGPGDCSNVPGTHQCINPGAGTGRCVQCTVATEGTDCPGSFCFPPGHPMANTCSGLPPHNVMQCNTCIADSQCAVGSMCGMDRLTGGQRCLPVAAAVPPPCPRPFADLPSETNDLGASASYCRSATSTCAPITRFRQPAGTCTGFPALTGAALTAANADCGETGVCRFSATLGNVCTFPCAAPASAALAADCPTGFSCVADPGEPLFGNRCSLTPG